MKKRCGFFYFCNKSGEVFDYSLYLLEKIELIVDRLIIVSKVELDDIAYNKFAQFTPNIYISKENKGFLEVLRFGLKENNELHLEISEYDELVYFDDSFFGPIYDFSEMFHCMENNGLDFWGISKRLSHRDAIGNLFEPYVEDYFVVLMDKLLHSKELICFLESTYEKENTPVDTFTKYFSNIGYKWDAFIKPREYESENSLYNFDMLSYAAYDLIKQFRCPVLRKTVFEKEKLQAFEYNIGNQVSNAIRFIKDNTDYNVDIIWKYILKNCNMTLIRQNLNLTYVITNDESGFQINSMGKIAVFAHIYYKDLLDASFFYLAHIPPEIDLWVTVCDKDAKQYLSNKLKEINRDNFEILIAGDRGRDIAALLITFKPYLEQYDYICFVHDKKTTGGKGFATVGSSFMYLMWDNLLGSDNYIRNVLKLFNKNKRMGVLTPPIPYHSGYIRLLGDSWTICYAETMKLAERLALEVDISPDLQPFALSTSFWCKTDALRPLLEHDFHIEDFPKEPMATDGTFSHALERILIYVAQNEGYYSAIIQNQEYASNNLTNMEYLLSKNIKDSVKSFGQQGIIDMFSGSNYENRIHLLKFVVNNPKVCIYGQGNNGKNVTDFFENQGIVFQYYIVSDGQTIKRKCYGHDGFYLSEILKEIGKIGIVVAVDKQYRKDIIDSLEQNGCKNYFIVF